MSERDNLLVRPLFNVAPTLIFYGAGRGLREKNIIDRLTLKPPYEESSLFWSLDPNPDSLTILTLNVGDFTVLVLRATSFTPSLNSKCSRGMPPRLSRQSTNVDLPRASFQKVEDDESTHPTAVADRTARSIADNDGSEFYRPEYYIRFIEPLESDLARQVEYDMDEQDKEWLDALNAERKKEQLDKATYELFEIVMDRLEKEWFELTRNIPKPDLALPSEDSTCAVCDDPEGENSNAIVFCDGCNLAVHQDCYGVPYIPEGQWLCRKCTVSPENPVSCCLCPNEGGAFKQTVNGLWVHLLCAMWIPETRVANDVFMEPITGVEKIPKQRWKLKCSLCDNPREGACIQCTKPTCFVAFHATCARKEKLLLPMKSAQGQEPLPLTCYCERHLPLEQQNARCIALALVQEEDVQDDTKRAKSARAHAKTYRSGPPLVPALILGRVSHYIGKIPLRKKQEFLEMMCRYWSLKRESRRGAPLLKRLHLEPWSANVTGQQSDEEKAVKLEQQQQLMEHLVRVREIAEMARKRESRKLRQAQLVRSVISSAVYPHQGALRQALNKIEAFDRNDYFKRPVSKFDVPDYFDIIKSPMSWSVIESKIAQHQYWDIEDFKARMASRYHELTTD
ncbi:hypothetical protein FISHEDRAFT_70399 [Fistulina hepatica ATCC 64428]|uniref:Uncharacterized protein n=1 Tax=Fistulina hepatica ATCC 64428 TaxID=1128425 RepID=A0A0D7AJ67_9AGAR|nr:hypothetical protein FISHEDRAFT_70399 [Fistulina hepatica ATCC 64428]